MQSIKPTFRIALFAIAVSLLCMTSVQAKKPDKPGGGGTTPRYTIVELGHQPGHAYGISASGDCVGEIADLDELQKPYFWLVDPSGEATPLPLSLLTPPGEPVLHAGSAQDISDDGLIVGYLLEPNVQTIAVYWLHALADPVFLPVPDDSLRSFANAVNNNGVIVGAYVDALGLLHPVAWGLRVDNTVDGPVELQAHAGSRGIAEDVNDSQAVVGWQADVDDPDHAEAWLWQLDWDGNTLSLDVDHPLTPLFPAESYVDSYAHNVNNKGDICGTRNPGGRAEAYFLERVEGTLVEQPLAFLIDNKRTGSANNFGRALNNANPPQIVGEASTFSKRTGAIQSRKAVLWQGSTVVDLRQAANSPTLTASPIMWAINDKGWIAGQAWTGETEVPSVPSVMIPKP